MAKKMIPVRFIWKDCKPDGGAYKPNSPTFEPVNVKVQVNVPESMVVSVDGEDGLVLTAEGAAWAMSQIRSAISQSYLED